jgi:glucose repression mediator protein
MASHQQPSPTTGMPPHHGAPLMGHPGAQPNGHPPQLNQPKTPSQYLSQLTETVWNQLGTLSPMRRFLDLTH